MYFGDGLDRKRKEQHGGQVHGTTGARGTWVRERHQGLSRLSVAKVRGASGGRKPRWKSMTHQACTVANDVTVSSVE